MEETPNQKTDELDSIPDLEFDDLFHVGKTLNLYPEPEIYAIYTVL